jgi:hypothetical protein
MAAVSPIAPAGRPFVSVSPRIKAVTRRMYDRGGTQRSVVMFFRRGRNLILHGYLNLSPPFFSFRSSTYRYFYHRYNLSWATERTVEVPIVSGFLVAARNKRILEVGNVLSHYCRVRHDVLDKYERAAGVVNEDVVSYRPAEKYDLIVSISTLEHVGWDEEEKDPGKVLKALSNLIDHCLAPEGRLVVTAPLGYNPHLDELLARGALPFQQIDFLKRVSKDNRWQQAHYEEIRDSRYDHPYEGASAVLVGIFEKSGARKTNGPPPAGAGAP